MPWNLNDFEKTLSAVAEEENLNQDEGQQPVLTGDDELDALRRDRRICKDKRERANLSKLICKQVRSQLRKTRSCMTGEI